VGRGLYYRSGRDIRRRGSSQVYATFTRTKLEVESCLQLIELLNGTTHDTGLRFQLEAEGHAITCTSVKTGDLVSGLELRGDNATRLKVLLERLNEATQ